MNYGLVFRALLICLPLTIIGCGQESSDNAGTSSGEATDNTATGKGGSVDVSDPMPNLFLSFRIEPGRTRQTVCPLPTASRSI